jgi:hypothetical protein
LIESGLHNLLEYPDIHAVIVPDTRVRPTRRRTGDALGCGVSSGGIDVAQSCDAILRE